MGTVLRRPVGAGYPAWLCGGQIVRVRIMGQEMRYDKSRAKKPPAGKGRYGEKKGEGIYADLSGN